MRFGHRVRGTSARISASQEGTAVGSLRDARSICARAIVFNGDYRENTICNGDNAPQREVRRKLGAARGGVSDVVRRQVSAAEAFRVISSARSRLPPGPRRYKLSRNCGNKPGWFFSASIALYELPDRLLASDKRKLGVQVPHPVFNSIGVYKH